MKRFLKKNPAFLLLVSWVYNALHLNIALKYRLTGNSFIWHGAFIRGISFCVKGRNNTIIIGRKARIQNCNFSLIGDNCKVIIGGGSTIISNTDFWCQGDCSSIEIGDHFTMEGGHLASTEGCRIKIGSDSMFSGGIEIRNGDSHSIFDSKTGERINHAKDVDIGDHVWLAANVKILKGSIVPSGSIVGNSSLVSGCLEVKNALYAGIPCRVIKSNINWIRKII